MHDPASELRRIPLPRTRVNREQEGLESRRGNLATLPCPLLLRTRDHHRAVSVADDGGGDASHQCPSHTSQAPAPHDYEPSAQLLGQVDDGLVAAFSDPKVGFFDTPSRLFDLLHLLVEHLLSFSLYRFERLLIGFVA